MRILLIDENFLLREGLKHLLQSNGIEVAGTFRDGTEALEKARFLKPDVILMNITRVGQGGLETIRRLKAEIPSVKIIILADSDDNLLEAVRSGAFGYLLTNIEGNELLQKLLSLERGEAPFSPGLTARILEGFAQTAEKEQAAHGPVKEQAGRLVEMMEKEKHGVLTARQVEVLRMVAQGLTYREAGEALGLTERTIKYHMGKIIKELHLQKREQAVAYVLQKNE